MSWKYGLKKDENGFLTLAEIYSDNCYTADNIVIGGEDYQEIMDDLRMILRDLEDPIIVDDLEMEE